MLHHVADFIGGGMVPSKVVVAGVDHQDITLLDFHPFLDHFAGVNVVIAADIAQIDDGGIVYQEIHIQVGDIFAGGVEMDFAIQMGAEVVGMGQQFAHWRRWAPGA